MTRKVPNEVPVGQLGVFRIVRLDVKQCAWNLCFGVRDYSANDLTNYETILEIVRDCCREGDLAMLVQLTFML